jgi:hypothetical protein
MSGRRAAALAAALALAITAQPARAVIPSATKVARAVAESNAASGRSSPLIFSVRLRIEGSAATAGPSAEGELAVHPSGLARLELRNGWGGFVERHLLQSNTYQASRNGELLADPHPFLPPVFLLQVSSGEGLAAALATFGVDGRQVVLGKMGAHDCYVFGGRAIGPGEAEHPLPSLWVDITSLDPLRIVRADGVEYRFGPMEAFGAIRVPSFIDVIARDGLRARLEVTRAVRAEAPAALFSPSWLTATPGAPSSK